MTSGRDPWRTAAASGLFSSCTMSASPFTSLLSAWRRHLSIRMLIIVTIWVQNTKEKWRKLRGHQRLLVTMSAGSIQSCYSIISDQHSPQVRSSGGFHSLERSVKSLTAFLFQEVDHPRRGPMLSKPSKTAKNWSNKLDSMHHFWSLRRAPQLMAHAF